MVRLLFYYFHRYHYRYHHIFLLLLLQYFCNMYSEHVKDKYGEVTHSTRMVLEVGE
jgi:hypothetical protein